MVHVSYPYEFPYPYDLNGRRFPVLKIEVCAFNQPPQPVAVDACLDSGAELSLFEGWIASEIGLVLLEGTPKIYSPAAGPGVNARMHRIRLSNASLGAFEMEIGFSVDDIRRNLLGRDFFNLIQLGFREHQQTFHILPAP
jgi:hypothetical protein